MLVYEITQPKASFWKGFMPNVARGFVQGFTGVDLPRQRQVEPTPALGNTQQPTERTVVAITEPGKTVATKYYKTGNVWTNELGQIITKPDFVTYLNRLIPYGQKETIPVANPTRKVSRQRVARGPTVKTTR